MVMVIGRQKAEGRNGYGCTREKMVGMAPAAAALR
jgi:hypothetical protein